MNDRTYGARRPSVPAPRRAPTSAGGRATGRAGERPRRVSGFLYVFLLTIAVIAATQFINRVQTGQIHTGITVVSSGPCPTGTGIQVANQCIGASSRTTGITTTATTAAYQQLAQYSFGTDTEIRAGGAAWSDPTLMRNMQMMDYQTIRFPGGLADEYDWKDGKYDLLPNDSIQWGYQDTVTTLSQLKTLYDGTHATPIFVLNVVTSGGVALGPCGSETVWDSRWQARLDDQIQFLQTAQNLGLPIKLVELGNEVYPGDGKPSCVFPSGVVYGSLMNYWIDALHQTFPGVQVALVGDYTNADNTWNHDVLTTARNFDAITVHSYIYEDSGLDASKGSCALQQQEYASLKTPQGAADLLSGISTWKVGHDGLTSLNFPPNVKLWLSESGTSDIAYGFSGTWAEGLNAAGFDIDLLRNPQVDELTDYLAVSDALYAEIFQVSPIPGYQGNRSSCTPFPQTLPYGFAPKGFTLQLLGQSLKGMKFQAPILFNPNPALKVVPGLGSASGSLLGTVYANGATYSGILENLSGTAVTIDLHALPAFSEFSQYSSPDPSMLTTGAADVTGGPNIVTAAGGAVPASRLLMLPAYSITELRQPVRKTRFQMYAVDQSGRGVGRVRVAISDNGVGPTTYTSDAGGRILVNTVVGHTITATVVSPLPFGMTSVTPNTTTSVVFDYNAKTTAGCGMSRNSCILVVQVAKATKFGAYVVDSSTGNGVSGVGIQVTDTSPGGASTTYNAVSASDGSVTVNTFIGDTVKMTVTSTPPSGSSYTSTTITSPVYDYDTGGTSGCGERGNSCVFTLSSPATTTG